ncbi:hypothetical protein PsYK624_146400 [Phanerochaete sordida]|uniref:Uncharacterized protein n=1 Tax=Phanerochaete sordida TaxID=48140 RepID=A0A9P3LKJ5_9APHY|nr:hypothetical protein PsYK624_146400 [Phanerochaete sordida]
MLHTQHSRVEGDVAPAEPMTGRTRQNNWAVSQLTAAQHDHPLRDTTESGGASAKALESGPISCGGHVTSRPSLTEQEGGAPEVHVIALPLTGHPLPSGASVASSLQSGPNEYLTPHDHFIAGAVLLQVIRVGRHRLRHSVLHYQAYRIPDRTVAVGRYVSLYDPNDAYLHICRRVIAVRMLEAAWVEFTLERKSDLEPLIICAVPVRQGWAVLPTNLAILHMFIKRILPNTYPPIPTTPGHAVVGNARPRWRWLRRIFGRDPN